LLPILVELGPLKVHAYGAALAISFLIGSIWVTRRARPFGYRDDHLMELFWWILISALVGSRIYYAIQHHSDFDDNFLGIFRIWGGGLTQYGGVIGALVVGGLYIRSRGWVWQEIVDLIAPTLALGEAITRIGCFLNGCCFGRETALSWGVSYPTGSHAHFVVGSKSIHPSQLYLMVFNLILFFFLARLKHLIGTSRVLALYLVFSSIIRFIVDFTRFYEIGDYIVLAGLKLTHSQWVSIGFIMLAVILWFKGNRKRPSTVS